MNMAASKVNSNFKEVALRERHFSEKQALKANSIDLFENVDHDGDTNHVNVKEQNIYSKRIVDSDEDDEEEEESDGSGKKLYIVIAVFCIAILALIGFGIFWYFKFWKDSSIAKLSPVEKVQKKCKEYTDLACSFKASSDKGPIQIVNGDRVPRGMLPHQACLQSEKIVDDEKYVGLCGGSLINERFILTAAHCVENVSLTGMKVLLGSLNRRNSNPTLWKKVKKFHVHPNYTSQPRVLSDISLLELEEDVKFNSDVRPICLNTKLEERYDLMLASGWGKTESGSSSDYLRMVEIHIDDQVVEYCRLSNNQNSLELREFINKTTICAAHLSKGPLQGDSGGPLQVKRKSNCENTWELIGITSTGASIPDLKLNRSRYVRLWMKMDAIKVDANFINNMLLEWSFSEKQTCKANRLFHGISDLDPSENFKNDRNTNHINEKEQYIYTRPIEDDEDDEEEEDDNGTGKKRILVVALGVICCIAILALFGFGIFWYFKFWKDSSISKLSPVEKVQKKCKEYVDLACSFKASSDKGPIQIVHGDRVPRGMLPHQAYLQFQIIGDDQYGALCGGSLINEKFILTAAHCLKNVSFTSMKVLLGSLNRDNSNLTLWKKIKKFHIHPNYTDGPHHLSVDVYEIDLLMVFVNYLVSLQIRIN